MASRIGLMYPGLLWATVGGVRFGEVVRVQRVERGAILYCTYLGIWSLRVNWA